MLREDRRTDGAAESGSAAAPHRRRSVARSRKNECRALRGANTKLRQQLEAVEAGRKAERREAAEESADLRAALQERDAEIKALKRTIATDTATLAGQKADIDRLQAALEAMTAERNRYHMELQAAHDVHTRQIDTERARREDELNLATGKLQALQKILNAAAETIVALKPDDGIPF